MPKAQKYGDDTKMSVTTGETKESDTNSSNSTQLKQTLLDPLIPDKKGQTDKVTTAPKLNSMKNAVADLLPIDFWCRQVTGSAKLIHYRRIIFNQQNSFQVALVCMMVMMSRKEIRL